MSEAGEDPEVRGILEAGTAAGDTEPLREPASALTVVAILKDPPVRPSPCAPKVCNLLRECFAQKFAHCIL